MVSWSVGENLGERSFPVQVNAFTGRTGVNEGGFEVRGEILGERSVLGKLNDFIR